MALCRDPHVIVTVRAVRHCLCVPIVVVVVVLRISSLLFMPIGIKSGTKCFEKVVVVVVSKKDVGGDGVGIACNHLYPCGRWAGYGGGVDDCC